MESIGQKQEVWTNEWKALTVESEIRMWDFYGLRPWILKYTPRFGEVLEAGCGLGRYNFYLSHFGIDITGLDFSEETINHLKKWQEENGYNLKFITGDVKNLPYDDNSLSGYLSFGVIEHFKEGPKKVLDEVYRVLKPGGIAIITTPNKSWNVIKNRIKRKSKDFIKKIIGREIVHNPFFQYEYMPNQLREFMKASKLNTLEVTGGDYLYSFTEFGHFTGKNIRPNSFAVKISPFLDKSFLKNLGSQSITISTKIDEKMQCFFCGEDKAQPKSLDSYTVPICDKCQQKEIVNHYSKSRRTGFNNRFIISPPVLQPKKKECDYCGKEYLTDKLFEDFGFTRSICPSCLRNHKTNIDISNKYIKPIWRKKK